MLAVRQKQFRRIQEQNQSLSHQVFFGKTFKIPNQIPNGIGMFSLVLGLTFLASLMFTILVEQFATYFSIFPKASYRRKSGEQVPLLGGVAIVLATLPGVIWLNPEWTVTLYVSFLPMFVAGIVDDFHEISGRMKVTAQVCSAVLWVTISRSNADFFTVLLESHALGSLVSIAFVLGLTNAFNLIDGIDGQATTVGALCLAALALIFPNSEPIWILFAASAAFLVRNFAPATIYLGEVGSSFLGFSLAALSCRISVKDPDWTHFIALLFLFSVPLSDTVGAMLRRLNGGVSLFMGDREHIHHRLAKLQFSTRQSWLVTSVLVLCGSLTAVLCFNVETKWRYALFLQAGSLLATTFWGLFLLEKRITQRLLGLSSQLIVTHLNSLTSPRKKGLPRRGMVMDLLPYFRELQGHGVLPLQDFLRDISQFLEGIPHASEVRALGSYSLLLLSNDTDEWSHQEIADLSLGLYEVFGKHRVVRGTTPIPEGVTFCDSHRLVDLLPISRKLDAVNKSNRAA